jgi:hypothetical protein
MLRFRIVCALILVLAFVIGLALAGVIPLRQDRVAAPSPGVTTETTNACWPAAAWPHGGRYA